MLSTVGREGLRSAVASLAPVARLPMAAAARPAGPGPTVRWQIHVLPSLVQQRRPTDLLRQIFSSGARGHTHDFVTDRESDRLYWLAKCINIAIRESGMRGKEQ